MDEKKKGGAEKKVDVLLANDASNAQWWIVDDGDDEVKLGTGLHGKYSINQRSIKKKTKKKMEIIFMYFPRIFK